LLGTFYDFGIGFSGACYFLFWLLLLSGLLSNSGVFIFYFYFFTCFDLDPNPLNFSPLDDELEPDELGL